MAEKKSIDKQPEHFATNSNDINLPEKLFCRKCGKDIPADSAFCPKCGERVIPVMEESVITVQKNESVPLGIQERVCKCGFVLTSRYARWCPKCGTKVAVNENKLSESTVKTRAEESSETTEDIDETILNEADTLQAEQSNLFLTEAENRSAAEISTAMPNHKIHNLGMFTAISSVIFWIWGSFVCGGTSRGYPHLNYTYHMYGEYAWGLFLQVLGIVMVGFSVIIWIIALLIRNNERNVIKHVILVTSLAVASFFGASIGYFSDLGNREDIYANSVNANRLSNKNIIDGDEAARLYHFDQRVFGEVFLIVGIGILIFSFITLIVLFTKKNYKKDIVTEQKISRHNVSGIFLVLLKFLMPTVVAATMLIMYFNTREFDFVLEGDKWYISHYYGSETELTLPREHFGGEVTGIAQNAFENSNITSLNIYASNDYGNEFDIQREAFCNCNDLETICFGSKIRTVNIAEYAFKDCINLYEISYGGEFNLDKTAFTNCPKFTDVD